LPTTDFNEIVSKISIFCGEHDFSGFMKSGGGSESSIRVVYRAFAYRHKGFIVLNFEANGFLRSQIRMMVGALLALSSLQIKEQLSLQKIHKIKPAPANGLYLAKVKYE
jgi:tRNA pseudouridine38-40 synthase